MPIPSHLNPITVLSKFKENAQNRANISLFQRDGKYRALADSLTDEFVSLKEEQITMDMARNLSNMSGRALDDFGDKVGMPRIRASHARVDFTESNLAFYVETGTFGTINGGGNITLSGSSLRISSNPNTNELNTSVDYVLSQPFTLLAADSIRYVSARAANIGTPSNVGESVLRRHNFTGYVDSANNTLKVINFYPIINGTDDEPDDLYKFRLANHYNRMIANNDTRMKLAALEIPGIVNTRVEPAYFGIGTAGVFALGPENKSNMRLITSLQQRLDGRRLPGGEYLATPATEVFFDFQVQVTPTRALTNQQIVRLKSELNKAFLEYFRSLNMGSVVDLTLLAAQAQKRVATVAAFSQKGTDRTFKRVHIRKGFSGGATDEKARVIGTAYSLGRDEFASLGTLNIEVL